MVGTIDAAVNGGTENYKKAFFNDEFERENPSKVETVRELKDNLIKQISILEEGLILHKLRCTPEMAALHDLLEKIFVEMKDKAAVLTS